jgi:eukaryotic-like serine/threonine-protein kinase
MHYGRYRIVKELGKGTMGVVYEAHDPQIDRLVALKILRPERMVSEAYVGRFLKEARAIGRLSHPSIVTIYDVGEDHGTIYIAMEYLKGTPFNEVIRSGRLTVHQSVDIARQVAEALNYAHTKAIVHRDIKPSNIILTDDSRVKLTDFGIARIEDAATVYQTQAGEILGTPVYMAPEQIMGQSVDGRSDLYALGVILYEMIVGRRPFSGDTIAAIFRSITQDLPQPPSEGDPLIPPALSDLIMKSLAKAPGDRFQTGRQMADALTDILLQTSPHHRSAVQVPSAVVPKSGKRLSLGIVVIALLMIIGTGIVFFLFRQGGSAATQGGPAALRRQGVEAESKSGQPASAAALQPQISKDQLAALEISSEPPGAQIYVDNAFKGRTPLNVELPLGKYEVRLNLPDYLEWEAQINLDTPGQTPLKIPLRPLN